MEQWCSDVRVGCDPAGATGPKARSGGGGGAVVAVRWWRCAMRRQGGAFVEGALSRSGLGHAIIICKISYVCSSSVGLAMSRLCRR